MTIRSNEKFRPALSDHHARSRVDQSTLGIPPARGQLEIRGLDHLDIVVSEFLRHPA
jgi:hypothetical protein